LRCGSSGGGVGRSSGQTALNPQLRPTTDLFAVSLATGAANMRAALAALLAVALLAAGAAAQGDFCEGEGWEALSPEVRNQFAATFECTAAAAMAAAGH